MRRLVSRGLAVAASVAALSGAPAPVSHAATAPACGAGSVVVPGSFSPVKVSLYEATETTTYVCVDVSEARTVVVVEGDGPLWVAVTHETAPGTCAISVVDLPEPRLALSVGADPAGAAVCVGTASARQTIQLHYGTSSALPNVDVWVNYSCTVRIIQHERGGEDDVVCTGADEKLL
ncbi:MAG TPA: hypothetical protein VNA20_03365 [Frankiaceae bacterium]|nr:hypothetical protein [Frankiaceae bacterium]